MVYVRHTPQILVIMFFILFVNLITYSNSWELSWRLIDSLNTHIDRIGQILHYGNDCVFYKKNHNLILS